MHAHTQELLDHLDRTRRDLRDAADAVPPNLKDRRPGPDRWSAAEVIEHLSRVESRVAAFLGSEVSAAKSTGVGPASSAGSAIDQALLSRVLDRRQRIDAPERAQPTGATWDTAWASLDRSRAEVRAAVTAADGLAIDEIVRPHPALGPLNLYQWIVVTGGHEVRHAAQIREISAALTGAPA